MTAKVTRRDGILEREVGDERMLYDSQGRAIHVLNETARFVWERCDGQHSLDEILAEAVAQYGVDEAEARTDIEECLATFRSLSLLEG